MAATGDEDLDDSAGLDNLEDLEEGREEERPFPEPKRPMMASRRVISIEMREPLLKVGKRGGLREVQWVPRELKTAH